MRSWTIPRLSPLCQQCRINRAHRLLMRCLECTSLVCQVETAISRRFAGN